MKEKNISAEVILAVVGIASCLLPIILNYPLYMKISQISFGLYLLSTFIVKNIRLRLILAFIEVVIIVYCGFKS
ncbi:MAG TPA: hypothetical protein VFC36_00285, partial [Paludibacter sp.]|nr:hypothetical protein [Paludibacter sp.]